jgi:hypothetical protein
MGHLGHFTHGYCKKETPAERLGPHVRWKYATAKLSSAHGLVNVLFPLPAVCNTPYRMYYTPLRTHYSVYRVALPCCRNINARPRGTPTPCLRVWRISVSQDVR